MNDTNMRPWYSEFLEKNAWAFALVVASIIAQWTVFSYRLNTDEQRLDKQSLRITTLESTSNSDAVALAQIQKDIEYIRLKLDKISP